MILFCFVFVVICALRIMLYLNNDENLLPPSLVHTHNMHIDRTFPYFCVRLFYASMALHNSCVDKSTKKLRPSLTLSFCQSLIVDLSFQIAVLFRFLLACLFAVIRVFLTFFFETCTYGFRLMHSALYPCIPLDEHAIKSFHVHLRSSSFNLQSKN